MKYYKVKKDADQKRIATDKKHSKLSYMFLIANELYTHSELKALEKRGYIINFNNFDIVDINKNHTFWSFGARFENKLK